MSAPALDADGCAADGACNQACGVTDVDCAAPPSDPGAGGTGGEGTGDDADDGGAASGGCASGGPARTGTGLLVALALLVLRRARRRAR